MKAAEFFPLTAIAVLPLLVAAFIAYSIIVTCNIIFHNYYQ